MGGHAENFAYVKLDKHEIEGSVVAAAVTEYKDGKLYASVLA